MSKTYILDRDTEGWVAKIAQIVAGIAIGENPPDVRIVAPDRDQLPHLQTLVDSAIESHSVESRSAESRVYGISTHGDVLTYCLNETVHIVRGAVRGNDGDIIIAFPHGNDEDNAGFMECVWSILIQHEARHLVGKLRLMPIHLGDEFASGVMIRDPVQFVQPFWNITEDGIVITPDTWKVKTCGSLGDITNAAGYNANTMSIIGPGDLTADRYKREIGYSVMACVLGRHVGLHVWIEIATVSERKCKEIAFRTLGDYAYLFSRIHFYRLNVA
jgi:hypothetical protein